MKRLRIPVALSVVMVATTTVATVVNCGGHGKGGGIDGRSDCESFCIPDGVGSGDQNCPFPTCASGPNFDQCPADCHPEMPNPPD